MRIDGHLGSFALIFLLLWLLFCRGRFRLKELHISPQGIREGILLAYARSGEHWLQYNETVFR